jgi:hypothetical protein
MPENLWIKKLLNETLRLEVGMSFYDRLRGWLTETVWKGHTRPQEWVIRQEKIKEEDREAQEAMSNFEMCPTEANKIALIKEVSDKIIASLAMIEFLGVRSEVALGLVLDNNIKRAECGGMSDGIYLHSPEDKMAFKIQIHEELSAASRNTLQV